VTQRLVFARERSTVPVAVVVPCHRSGRTIRRALGSVMNQTALPEEIILVDDASGDDSLELLQALADEIGRERVRVIALARNVGAGEARNAGWNAARSSCVAFLDADDAWHPQKLEIQWRHMRANPDVGLTGHLSQQVLALPESISAAPCATAEAISFSALLLSNRFVTPSVMLRREIGIRFEADRRHMEDHLLWLRIACSGVRIERLPCVLCYTFKPAFGHEGLSAALWQMERGELANYRLLQRDGCIGATTAVAFQLWSLSKFVRRIAIVVARRLLTR
jgi:glycosyltransferase involved in cell wall biosynthesis